MVKILTNALPVILDAFEKLSKYELKLLDNCHDLMIMAVSLAIILKLQLILYRIHYIVVGLKMKLEK